MKKRTKKVVRWTAFHAIASLALLTGCGGGKNIVTGGGGSPPVIKSSSANPVKLARFAGGQVAISTQVKAASGVANVTARIVQQQSGQTLMDVPLQQQGKSKIFQATINAPANTRNDGQSETYTVTIIAADNGGQQTIANNIVTFEVPAPPAAPGPPNP